MGIGMENDPASPFEAMAARIAAIKPAEFAGAIVFVPPADPQHGLEPVDMLLTSASPQRDIAFFWSTVKAKVEAAISEVQLRYMDRSEGPFGRR